MLTRQFDPEEIKTEQVLEFELDYRPRSIIKKYSDVKIHDYIKNNTVFVNSFTY